MLKFTATISFLLSVLIAQVTAPFELELRTRLVNNDRTMVNIQITNLMDKPLDYVEGFVSRYFSVLELFRVFRERVRHVFVR